MAAPESSDALKQATSGLREFSATELASQFGSITRAVYREGAAVITKHQQPVMVLLSVERYASLQDAATPNLGALSRRFEELYAHMQQPGVAERTVQGLDLGTRRSAQRTKRAARRAR